MKKLVVFDLDGTLLDTTQSLNECMNNALKINGFNPISLSQTRAYVGNGAYVFALKACGDEQKASKVLESFMEIYQKYPTNVVPPFEHITTLLQRLKNYGIKTAVFSNKPHVSTVNLCESVFGKQTFDFLLGHKDAAPTKPNPQGLLQIIEYFNLSKQNVILIGDGETDAQTAINAGVDFIGALWGLRDKQTLQEHGATVFANTPSDLFDLLFN